MTTPIVVIDCETTHYSPKYGRLIEIGAARIDAIELGVGRIAAATITETWQTYVNPNGPIPRVITDLTGIDADTVKGAPPAHIAVGQLLRFVDGAPLAAFNAPFDVRFLQAARRDWPTDPPVRDVARIARAAGYTGKLAVVAAALGVEPNGNLHSAEVDAVLAAQVLLRLIAARGAAVLTAYEEALF